MIPLLALWRKCWKSRECVVIFKQKCSLPFQKYISLSKLPFPSLAHLPPPGLWGASLPSFRRLIVGDAEAAICRKLGPMGHQLDCQLSFITSGLLDFL
jgi:hypothetical protein